MPALASTCAVLVVDDHSDTAGMLRWFLQRQGLDVETADSATAALAFLDGGHRPTCILLDQMMPGMTGLELLRLLKSRPDFAPIHVFMYSASYDWHDQQTAESLGAEAWFVKGVTPLSDLLAKLMTRCLAED